MHTLMLDLVPMATQAADLQAKGGFIRGIGKILLVIVVLLVGLGLFIGMKIAKRRR